MVRKILGNKWLWCSIVVVAIMAVVFQQYRDTQYTRYRYGLEIPGMKEEHERYEDYVKNREKELARLEERKQRHEQEVLTAIPEAKGKAADEFEGKTMTIFKNNRLAVIKGKGELTDRFYAILTDYHWELEGQADAIRKALAEIEELPRLVDWLLAPTGLKEAKGPFKGKVGARLYYLFPTKEAEKPEGGWEEDGLFPEDWLPEVWLPPFVSMVKKIKEAHQKEREELLAFRKNDTAEKAILSEMAALNEQLTSYNYSYSLLETVSRNRITLEDIYFLAGEPDPEKQEKLRKDLINSKR